VSQRHLQRVDAPLVSLSALRVVTFRASTLGGSFFRMAVNAIVFLVPLLLQYRFGWSAARAGLYLSALFLGNMAIKPFTRQMFTRMGFRRVLIVVIIGSAITIAVAGVLAPGTPSALIAVVLFVSGALRSVGFTAYNTIAFADVAPADLTDANTLFSAVQQLGVGLGVAAGAIALRIGTAVQASSAYPIAFGLVAALLLIPLWDVVQLSPNVGANLTARQD
jgi:MFS family permease